jgi:proteasome lid subunit RPN8/RPN11
LKFIHHDTGLQIQIQKELLDELYGYGLSYYPKEYGGILVGRYEEDCSIAFIEETLLPKKYTSSRYYFDRGSEGLKHQLEVYYRKKPKLFYVGEWHTHPDGPATPSLLDKSTMLELAKHETVYINNPILLILGITPPSYETGFYVQLKNNLTTYERAK